MTDWVVGTVQKTIYWSKELFSIIVKAEVDYFIPGQFAKLSLDINNKNIQRAYSYINAPSNKNNEFYIKNIVKGKLTSYLLNLKYNDKIMISKKALGTFTIKNIHSCDYLWMFATGTGIGPYLSILQDGNDLHKFTKIILVYSIRLIEHYNYINLIKSLKKKYNDKLIIQIVLTKYTNNMDKNILYGRITTLLLNKILEHKIGISISKNTTHVMLCGNPNMIKETQNILQTQYNLTKNYIDLKGHITTEQYW
ncbi:FAD-binding oxidoreductase [Enterobacteriaceae endosymbiont of Neohaemonia nigricornis]|uniref:FAD-binding oxidoreductase n=1 Tax=Enterobacteriaceae endosymbiont of Neohaemonia nigricornis TaxID=2675792 RepID=UPI001449731E|nr:FAD-binding oxidoreductase [Enterobacteriaceae endosymbiont of Neohaemonia nigricornis]QJC30384.1 ferredoxin--NADP(+) reductase [Enterobacteriaceae endosymbiont of Neohaemonia nigricornis]